MKKRLLSLTLVLVMCLGLLPMTAAPASAVYFPEEPAGSISTSEAEETFGLVISPSMMDFGTFYRGQPEDPRSITVRNNGDLTLTVSMPELPDGFSYASSVIITNQYFTLSPGESWEGQIVRSRYGATPGAERLSLDVTVRYTDGSKGGYLVWVGGYMVWVGPENEVREFTVADALTLCYEAISSSDASEEEWLKVSESVLNFGTVTAFADQKMTFTITNSGPVQVKLDYDIDDNVLDFDPLWAGISNPDSMAQRRNILGVSFGSQRLKPGESTTCTVTLKKQESGLRHTEDGRAEVHIKAELDNNSMKSQTPVSVAVQYQVLRDNYNLRVNDDGSYGRVYVNGTAQGMYDDDSIFPVGTSVQLEIKPYNAELYHVANLIINNKSLGPVSSYTLKMDTDANVRVEFAPGPAPVTAEQQQPTVTFTDVPDWAKEAVDWAVDQKITNGTGEGKFSPNDTCTRAQILTFLYRAKGEPAVSIANPFTDVKESDYYYKAAIWAAEQGLVSGNALDPNAPCTRSAVVTYLWKLAGSPAAQYDNSFTDVAADAEYAQAVAWAVANDVTNGMGDGTFGPGSSCTRGQIVTFLHRAYK